MKCSGILSLFLFFLSFSCTLIGQSVGINTENPNSSAALEIQSTNKGLLIPRMTSNQRTSIVSPANSLLVYDSDLSSFWYYNSGDWIELGESIFEKQNGLVRNRGSHGTDDFVFGADQMPIALAKDTLFFFDKQTGAFRTGNMNSGNAWVQDSLGKFSFGAGQSTIASGDYSVALGQFTQASGNSSFAIGQYSEAKGNYSIAGGNNNTASGSASFSVGGNNNSSGFASTSFGNQSEATGSYSTAGGNLSLATGSSSFAIGSQNAASATASMAFGIQTEASGAYSLSAGRGTQAQSRSSTAFGRFNVGGGNPSVWDGIDPIFEVGIGAADTLRENALTILKNGNIGIGTNDPETLLDLRGAAQIISNSNLTLGQIVLQETSTTDFARILMKNDNPETFWTLAARSNADTVSSAFNIHLKGVGNIMSLAGDKQIGIGTSSPSDRLHINSSTGEPALRVQVNGQTKLRVHSNGGTSIGLNITPASNGLYVSGKTGLGVTNPTAKLEVNGNIKVGYNDDVSDEGTLRYNQTAHQFEGYTDDGWNSFKLSGGELEIGDIAHGGIVFWLDETGEHGLVIMENDLVVATRWYAGTFGRLRAEGRGIYGGEMNTPIIVAGSVATGDDGGSFAAQLCADLHLNGFGDWYLPSRDELQQVYDNLFTPGLETFLPDHYWTSTESAQSPITNARTVLFIPVSFVGDGSKANLNPVRAIRSF